MKTTEATGCLTIEVPGPGEVNRPLIHVKAFGVLVGVWGAVTAPDTRADLFR